LQARREIGRTDVKVYNACEVNLVKIAMQGRNTVTNNVLAFNQTGGIRFSGDAGDPAAGPLQPAVVPFGRVLNNTIYGADRNTFQQIPADIVFVIDTSGTMADDVQSIRRRIGDFDTALKDAGIDPRYGLVTFPGDGATPVQIHPIEAWDLLDALARGSDAVLGGFGSQWRKPRLALGLLLGELEAPTDALAQWAWMRNPLPPASE
jgi:hypothetical protein